MYLARLTMDYKGDKVVVTLKMSKPKGYYVFSFKRDKELVTITKPYPNLVNELDEVDIRLYKEECVRLMEDVLELMEEGYKEMEEE